MASEFIFYQQKKYKLSQTLSNGTINLLCETGTSCSTIQNTLPKKCYGLWNIFILSKPRANHPKNGGSQWNLTRLIITQSFCFPCALHLTFKVWLICYVPRCVSRKNMSNQKVCISDFEEKARKVLPKAVYDYYCSGADEQKTLNDNVAAFKR